MYVTRLNLNQIVYWFRGWIERTLRQYPAFFGVKHSVSRGPDLLTLEPGIWKKKFILERYGYSRLHTNAVRVILVVVAVVGLAHFAGNKARF